MPIVVLIYAVFMQDWPIVWILGMTVVVQSIYHAILRMAAFKLPPWSGITYPFGGLIVTLIILDGMIRLATGRDIQWKGRSLLGRPAFPVKRDPRGIL